MYIHEVYYEKEVKGSSLQTLASADKVELQRGKSLYKNILADILSERSVVSANEITKNIRNEQENGVENASNNAETAGNVKFITLCVLKQKEPLPCILR